jgi:hypothetical protein
MDTRYVELPETLFIVPLNTPQISICIDGRERTMDSRLANAAPLLLAEAGVLRCLATSPRFQSMTVADALAELAINGCGHDGGAAIAAAEGK